MHLMMNFGPEMRALVNRCPQLFGRLLLVRGGKAQIPSKLAQPGVPA